jgi:hypothetical protein
MCMLIPVPLRQPWFLQELTSNLLSWFKLLNSSFQLNYHLARARSQLLIHHHHHQQQQQQQIK